VSWPEDVIDNDVQIGMILDSTGQPNNAEIVSILM
jgi:hypothetical protein